MKVVLHRFLEKGLIQLLDPRPLPNPLSPNFDMSANCELHRSQGHDTKRCMILWHLIQNLIDSGKISPPVAPTPNVNTNTLPNHQAMLPLANINLVMFDVIHFDPTIFIVPKGSLMPRVTPLDFLFVAIVGDDLWYKDPDEDYNEIFRIQSSEGQGSEKATDLWDMPGEGTSSGPVMAFEELTTKADDVSVLLANLQIAQQTNHLMWSGRHFKPHELEGNAPISSAVATKGTGLERVFERADDRDKGKGIEVVEENPILK